MFNSNSDSVLFLQLVHVTEDFPLAIVLMAMDSVSVSRAILDLIVISVMRDFMDFLTANVSVIHLLLIQKLL